MAEAIPFTLAAPLGERANLGLIVLQSDETIEHEFRSVLPPAGVTLFHSRVESAPEVTRETLAQMEHDLPSAAGRLPRAVGFDVVGYGCTSGASVIGAEKVAALISCECSTKAVTEPLSALIAACRHLGLTRIAFLSPYVEDVSRGLRDVLGRAGVETPVFGSFEESEETRVAQIDGASVVAGATALAAQGGVEAVFLSCTNLRSFDVIDQIEKATGLPVLSSNQVLFWHMAQLAGVSATGPGRLFES